MNYSWEVRFRGMVWGVAMMERGYEFLRCVREDFLAIVTIDRPPVNALSKQVLLELQEVLAAWAADLEIRVVIVTGAGNKAFVAGADIGGLADLTPATGKQLNRVFQSTFNQIADFSRPVICAVNGLAFGGGCELALACDLRVAAESARFGLTEVNLGLIPGGGGTVRLPRIIPVGMAKELIFSGRHINADEAEKIGLVNRVVPEGEVLDAAREIGRRIAGKGPVAVEQVKKAINRGLDLPLSEAMDLEADLSARCFGTADFQEGVKAFFAKRTPNFNGR